MAKAFAERPMWQRSTIIGGWILIALVVLVQCSGSDGAQDDAFEGNLRAMGAPGTYSGTLAEDAGKDALIAAAREQCEGRAQCQVLGWPDGVPPATAWPMLPREVETLAFSYRLNRSTGFEQALFDCARFPGKPEQCLPSQGDAE